MGRDRHWCWAGSLIASVAVAFASPAAALAVTGNAGFFDARSAASVEYGGGGGGGGGGNNGGGTTGGGTSGTNGGTTTVVKSVTVVVPAQGGVAGVKQTISCVSRRGLTVKLPRFSLPPGEHVTTVRVHAHAAHGHIRFRRRGHREVFSLAGLLQAQNVHINILVHTNRRHALRRITIWHTCVARRHSSNTHFHRVSYVGQARGVGGTLVMLTAALMAAAAFGGVARRGLRRRLRNR